LALLADAAFAVWNLWSFFASGETVDPNWPLNLLVTLGVMMTIGISEELTYRGLIFNGLLAPLGKTRRGMYVAVALAVVTFGLAHVTPSDFASPMLAVQALLKVTQAGLWALIPIAVLMRTGDVISAGLYHGLGNLLLSTSMIIEKPELTISYTSSDPGEATAAIWVYALVIVMYMPSVYAAICSIRAQPAPCNGAFAQAAPRTESMARVEPIVPCLPAATFDGDAPAANAPAATFAGSGMAAGAGASADAVPATPNGSANSNATAGPNAPACPAPADPAPAGPNEPIGPGAPAGPGDPNYPAAR
jgi:membrane protease YdiL (CAAX protease family)